MSAPNPDVYDVLSEVATERLRQIEKWGGPDAVDAMEHAHHPNGSRLRILVEEFGEALDALPDDAPDADLIEVVHLSRLIGRVAEAMGRPEDGNGKGDLREELIQVAACAVAWVEGLDAR